MKTNHEDLGSELTKQVIGAAIIGPAIANGTISPAMALPAQIGLSFSPYAAGLADWRRQAAGRGHELLLDLPLQPARYPADDSGPLTLMVATDPAAQAQALARLLGEPGSWRAVVVEAGAFAATPSRFAPVAEGLAGGFGALIASRIGDGVGAGVGAESTAATGSGPRGGVPPVGVRALSAMRACCSSGEACGVLADSGRPPMTLAGPGTTPDGSRLISTEGPSLPAGAGASSAR